MSQQVIQNPQQTLDYNDLQQQLQENEEIALQRLNSDEERSDRRRVRQLFNQVWMVFKSISNDHNHRHRKRCNSQLFVYTTLWNGALARDWRGVGREKWAKKVHICRMQTMSHTLSLAGVAAFMNTVFFFFLFSVKFVNELCVTSECFSIVAGYRSQWIYQYTWNQKSYTQSAVPTIAGKLGKPYITHARWRHERATWLRGILSNECASGMAIQSIAG